MAEKFQFRLDPSSGLPAYRQLTDQILIAVAAGALAHGEQLPTVRQTAVDLSINPNTVVRAYKEMEIRGFLRTQQGIGTFITTKKVKVDEAERQELLSRMVGDFVARASAAGYSVDELIERLGELKFESGAERSSR